MRNALTVADWLSQKYPKLEIRTIEQLKEKRTSGECPICLRPSGKYALCRWHRGAFHRWQREVENERTHAFIVVLTETNLMMDARAEGFKPKYSDVICDALGAYSESLRNEWDLTALFPFTIEVSGGQ